MHEPDAIAAAITRLAEAVEALARSPKVVYNVNVTKDAAGSYLVSREVAEVIKEGTNG